MATVLPSVSRSWRADGLRTCAAIGVFDGVHIGHQHLLAEARKRAPRVVAVTFDPHPRRVFGMDVRLLCPLQRRVELLLAHGADGVAVTRFDRHVASTHPLVWASETLGELGAVAVAVGAGFRFGKDRRGDAGLLRQLGFDVVEVDLQAGASSTAVREHLAAGRIADAASLLGRPVEQVVEARRRHTNCLDVAVAEPTMLPVPAGRYRCAWQGGHGQLLVTAEGAMKVCPDVSAQPWDLGTVRRLTLHPDRVAPAGPRHAYAA